MQPRRGYILLLNHCFFIVIRYKNIACYGVNKTQTATGVSIYNNIIYCTFIVFLPPLPFSHSLVSRLSKQHFSPVPGHHPFIHHHHHHNVATFSVRVTSLQLRYLTPSLATGAVAPYSTYGLHFLYCAVYSRCSSPV